MKLSEFFDEGKRIPRKKGQPAGSKKHSDLYTDENPKGTIQGLKFATVKDAKASVSKIRNSGKKHAHKIQAAVAMEQRAKAAGKSSAAAVYRSFINRMKKKTKKMNEGEERQIIHRATVDKLVDHFENRVDSYDTLVDLHDAIYNELSYLDMEDIGMEGVEDAGQPLMDFHSGRVLDVLDSYGVIDDVVARLDLSELDESLTEMLVANKNEIIDAVLKTLKDEAYEDDKLFKELGELAGMDVNPRSHNKPLGKWQMEPIKEEDDVTSGDRNIALYLPRGDMKVLKAEDKDYDRGLLVKLLDDGGYDMAYWYEKHVPFEVEVLVDGKSIKKDAKIVTMKFHPELDSVNKKVNKFRLYDIEADIKDLKDKINSKSNED